MNYRCQHCGETVTDLESRAARETCYVAVSGKHKWQESLPEGQQTFDLTETALSEYYGTD